MTATTFSTTKRRIRPYLLSLIGLLITAVFVAPYAVMLLDALRPSGDVLASPTSFLPRTWQFSTFNTVLGDSRFLAWLKTSLLVAVSSTAIVLVVAVPAAYFTARFRFFGRGAFLLLVLITQMFSPTSLVVGIYREFFELNLVNTYMAIILTNSAFNLAFAIWILQGFFSSIPRDIEEAAYLDGCGRLSTLRHVMLPLTRPGLVTATIFTFIAAWNEYVVALTLMQDDAKKPLTVGISSYVTGYEQHWDELFAASIIAIVPVVVLFALIEKHLVGGLTAGSVK
jgi:multiple sugar transport system permease protein